MRFLTEPALSEVEGFEMTTMLRSVGLMAILTLVWGMNWSVMKIGASQLPPLWFRTLGLIIGTALLGAMLALRGTSLRLPRGALRRVIALSFPNIMVWYSIVTIAVTLLPAGRAAILGFTMPAWAALIGVVVYRERLDARIAIGVACAVAAIALLVSGDWSALIGHPLGMLLMLIAAFSWAWGTHALRRATITMETLALTFWMMLVACPVLLIASALLEGSQWRVPHGHEWAPILYNAVPVLAIGNLIWFTVARTLSPTAAGLSSMLIPVVGVFSGIALLDEAPGWRDVAALVLVCTAVGAALLRKSDRQDP
jgi:drug/metabolite transporter (DMT)-like permease